ncbi:LysR family transcriptional regulator, partial [Paraphotobacterium marinum]
MNLSIKQIETFIVFSKLLSVSLTAKKVNLSQPAVSKIIKEIEHQVGARIIERIENRVYLTKEGKVLVKYGKRLLKENQLLKENILIQSRAGYGEITLSVHNAFQDILFDAVSQFILEFPNIKINFLIDNRNNILNQIKNNEADFYFLAPVNNNKQLTQKFLYKSKMTLVAPPQHPLTQKKNVRPQDLNNETILIPERSTTIYQELDQLLTSFNIQFKTITMNNNLSIQSGVAFGLGLALLPEVILHQSINNKLVIPLNLIDKDRWISTFLIYHSNRELSPSMKLMKDF